MQARFRVPVGWLVVAITVAPFILGEAAAQPPAEALVVAPDTTGPVFQETNVDNPVRPKLMQRPEYPPGLRAQRICGSADVTYIVGTNGRAEPASLAVLQATNPRFGEAALDALRLSVFHPAKRAGKVVRQRVTQRISFNLAALDEGQCGGDGSSWRKHGGAAG